MIKEDTELVKLEAHIKHVLKKDFYRNRIVECCPACTCKEYIKYGSYNGIQRYRCKECGKTFSNTTNSLYSYSKKNLKLWIEFAELMIEKKSLRFCAETLNISLVTAFYWRHKILHSLSLNSTPNMLKGIIYISKTVILENFKGCRNLETDYERDRRKNVWIFGAKGDEDSMFVKPVFKVWWDLPIFREKVYSKIEKNSYLVSYGDTYLSAIAKKHNKKRVLQVNHDDRLRFFILNLKNWLAVYHGVATKYLQRYLSFFVLFNLNKSFDYMDIITHDLFGENQFKKTYEIRTVKNQMY